MPLTPFQKQVLGILSASRSEVSHFAGGVVLHAADDSARYSHDFDIFHDVIAEVDRTSRADVERLRQAGFAVETVSPHGEWEQPSSFRRARVGGQQGSTEVDWAADSAFRFFPIERDDVLGWRLHLFDVATNKALALCARIETRDYVDIVELGRVFPLAAICWAACGKDPGFTPLSALKMMRRFARIDPAELDKLKARDLNPIALKEAWIAMSDEAETKITALADKQPEMPIGVAFVDAAGTPGWIGDDPTLRLHAPSMRGCWPVVHAKTI